MKFKQTFFIMILLSGISTHGYNFHGRYLFFKRFLADPKAIGSITPTSKYTAAELIKPLTKITSPRTILEIGAGDGPITKYIVEQLNSDDRFDVLELDEILCDVLRDKFKQHKQLNIRCMPMQEWNPGYQYDIIISTIPLTNLSIEELESVLKQFERLAKPSGILSYLELMGCSAIRKCFSSKKRVKNLEKKLQMIDAFRNKHETTTRTILRNVPPTYVHHIVIKG